MKLSFWTALLAAAGLGLAAAPVEAQYRPPPAPKEEVKEEETFEDAVDLKRFRKGRIDWDTQQLVASGFTALHGEHEKILEELQHLRREQEALKKELSELKAIVKEKE
ncbi:MAG: hypothetical protein HYS41_02680 [Candidatus Omnitrophica bacterium]|nr:hypothetical protein [Candidatus Omnitrophota bacterium]